MACLIQLLPTFLPLPGQNEVQEGLLLVAEVGVDRNPGLACVLNE